MAGIAEVPSEEGRSVGIISTVQIAKPDGSTASLDNHYLKPDTYAERGQAAFPPGYWDTAVARPITVGMRARLGV